MLGRIATYVLIHGAGSDGWHWHLVAPLLRERGHQVIAPDLPVADPDAGLELYTHAVIEAMGDATHVVLVAQSLGAFVAPLVCERRPVELLVLVNGMVPRPGESDWWSAAGYPLELGPDFDPVETFLHDVPEDVRAASADHVFEQSDRPMDEPHPLERWPDVPTAFVLSRDDRFFPAEWQRGIVRERLGIEPVEIPGGHCPALSRPEELVSALERLRAHPPPPRV